MFKENGDTAYLLTEITVFKELKIRPRTHVQVLTSKKE